MGATLTGDNRRVGDQRVVDTRERHQVSLELCQVDVQSAVEAQAGGDGANDLCDEAVQVIIARAGDIQVTTANVVDSLVIHQEGAVGVLDSAVGGQDGIVGLHHSGRHARRRVDREFELGLLAVLSGELLQQSCTEAGAGTATEGVEDKESL